MKKTAWVLMGGLLIALNVVAQQLPCDCEDCRRRAASGKQFTMTELDALNQPAKREAGTGQKPRAEAEDHHADDAHDHDHDDHAAPAKAACGSGCADTGCADTKAAAKPEQHDHDGHADHDEGCDHDGHVDAGGVEVTGDMAATIGLKVERATGGQVAQSVTFPAEIKINRDRHASVRPRYNSRVREVFVEIGQKVQSGDRLAALENLETLAQYDLTAPLDGVVVAKDVAAGETADTGKTLVEVADLSTVWADISIFPKYQHAIQAGLPVLFVAHDGHTSRGTISYVSPLMSRTTRTFTARCVLMTPREDFTPGAFVRAQIVVHSARADVRVPGEAIQTIGGETVVFVPGTAGYITRPVTVGLRDDRHAAITQGLTPGEPYVAAGAFSLKAAMITSGMDPHAGHGH